MFDNNAESNIVERIYMNSHFVASFISDKLLRFDMHTFDWR